MSYTALDHRRVSDITVSDIGTFLRAAQRLPYVGAQLVATCGRVEFARQSEIRPRGKLGVVAAADSVWIRVDADPLGVWCALQAWSAGLTAAPATVKSSAAVSRELPGVGETVWHCSEICIRLAQDWAAARGYEGIEIGLAGSVLSAVWPVREMGLMEIETGVSVCAGVYAAPGEILAALTMLVLATELRVKKRSP